MNQIYHMFRQMCNGKSIIGLQAKFMSICIALSVIHFVFACEFGIARITPLFWYNVAAAIFYLYLGFVLVSKERYMFIYLSSGVEILFHVILATLMLGWDWGFGMYTMSLIPAGFYFTYTMPKIKGNLRTPIQSSVVVSAIFLILGAVSDKFEPLYKGTYPDIMQKVSYYFNTVIALIMLVVFSTFFAVEINYMQKKLEKENQRLGEIANFDPLTHLLNRRSMNQDLRVAHEAAEQFEKLFCIMLVDLDDFKMVNDTYGHDCGDKVLVSVANIISNDVREKDSVCRWGGEEILVLLNADLDVARQVAERICKDVRENVVSYKDEEVNVTLTIGIADYKKDQTVRSMIEEADRNMYYGKHHGKNQVVTSYERIDD